MTRLSFHRRVGCVRSIGSSCLVTDAHCYDDREYKKRSAWGLCALARSNPPARLREFLELCIRRRLTSH
jgi:hypothetical protein